MRALVFNRLLAITLLASLGICPRSALAATARARAHRSAHRRVPAPRDPVLRRHLRGKTVLVLGDSMIPAGLEIWIRQVIRIHGGRYRRWAWASSTTKRWATSGVLARALRKYRPDLVLIVLGSNELFLDHPARRARYVRAILKAIAPRPYRWLGPPAWSQDTGILEVLRRTIPAGRFYPFNGRAIARDRDGHHPTAWGARTWTYDFVRWWIHRLKRERRGGP